MAEALEKQYTARKVLSRQDELLELARAGLAASSADQTQLRVVASDSALTRFANSEIHQSTFEREALVTVTARIGQREGVATTNRLAKDGILAAVEQATAAARVSEPNPDLADFPEGPRDYPTQVDYFEATAACTPEERAKKVVAGFNVNNDPGFTAAGTLSSGQVNCVIANSRGIEAAYNTTNSKYTILWTGPDSSGYHEHSSRNVNDIHTESVSVAALATALRSAKPRSDIPEGRYTVVLDAECIATMLNFMCWVGLSGKDYLDGASFMCGKLGEPVTGSDFTLADDALDPRTLGLPCDAAGTPKQRLMLIEGGVARAVAHDASSAKRAGTVSTGHDTGFNFPMPANLVLAGGVNTREELIAGIQRGILVSRFHYTNVVDPLATVITGMTRDGTFLIEDGALVCGLTNFRFTQNILQAFANCSGMSSEQVFHSAFWGSGSLVPEAVRIEEFNFSGKTGF